MTGPILNQVSNFGRVALACLLISSSLAQSARQPDPVLTSSSLIVYPPLARAAHVSGSVAISFTINAAGQAAGVTLVSGQPLLAVDSIAAVRSWRFKLPPGFRPGTRFETTFDFELLNPQSTDKNSVSMDSFRRIVVKASTGRLNVESGCPESGAVQVPQTKTESDFVELSRWACYGSCPVYSLRVYRSGEVEWKGEEFVAVTGEARSRIDPKTAGDLLDRFEAEPFWSACEEYSYPVTDSATVNLEARIGGSVKKVSEYADSGPDLLRILQFAVDEAADSHRWRHGDPGTEPLTNLYSDAYLPKPGVTALMKAAVAAKEDAVSERIKAGDDVNAEDSSGWTALMYASATFVHGQAANLLLRAGANPAHLSKAGDTALMACATTGRFCPELARAAKSLVNLQDNEGRTALMFLTTRADPKEIARALAYGANASLRDRNGKTALDYLRAANCFKSPLRNQWRLQIPAYMQCSGLDRAAFKKSEALLLAARKQPGR